MSALMTCSLLQIVAASTATTLFAGRQHNELRQCSQFRRGPKSNIISVPGKVSVETTLRGLRCYATQTQNLHRKSSTATIKRVDPKGKVNGLKLDDGNGGFPPFHFGKGGGGGGGGEGGSNYFGGSFLFACVLLLDYLKEAEKNLLRQGYGSGDQASIGLVQ
ncbi:unnamed protein product [Urochloa decumbens]|uniref:Uncharacterized protein n=1 Tax=Urochloa decumbens TaxID=240449 RepID=A0ABC9E8L4_9POAL